MKDYSKELMDMNREFNALCKKYNHTGIAVVTEGKGEYFLSSVNSETEKELIDLIAHGYNALIGAMFTCYGNDNLKEARYLLGDMLNKKYCQRLNMVKRGKTDTQGERIRGKVIHDWQDQGIVLIVGDDKRKYLGHWDFAKKGRLRKAYFIPGEPEVLPDGTVAKCPTALDIKRFSEIYTEEETNE